MKTIQRPWIKLKEFIDHEDYELINKLQEKCINEDQIALKLELDYKLAVSSESKNTSIQEFNEFMYFDGDELIGYIGTCRFGGPIEANGMVHPEYRGQGVFKTLSDLVIEDYKKRNSGCMLLLCDRKSNSGQKFIKETGAQYRHSEYEMYLKKDNLGLLQSEFDASIFRKATNADATEIARQNTIYFNGEFDAEQDMILPEEEEKRGMTIYLAEVDQNIVGKVHIQLHSGTGGIYGLGVLPEYRGKGYGRSILMMAIEKLKEANASEIMLQVAAENSNALNLYKSCGFMETSTMDYYEIKA